MRSSKEIEDALLQQSGIKIYELDAEIALLEQEITSYIKEGATCQKER